eukprot:TRINITY_DN2115_c0_g2_i2.p1 TRINITY_DN2115_c0_g2~~TRINITY_DN2115_c0_g2_i2.p1  ORF type:complete len:102 (+),score=21.72 TRINITY_DN2115_c0_g2_i2:61-366(+)
MGDAAQSLECAIWQAASHGYNDDLVELRKTAVNVNAGDSMGNTALHLAAQSGRRKTLELVLSFPKVDINAINNVGETALHRAAWKGKVGAVKVRAISLFPD